MTHLRQQIRDAVKVLLTDLATTKKEVYIGRTRPLGKDYEPTLLIYTTDDPERVFSEGYPRTMIHNLTLRVEGHVVQPEPPDDVLDRIEVEVKTKLASVPRLTGTGGKYITNKTTPMRSGTKTDASGDQHEGGILMEFAIEYTNKENDPENPA